MLEKQYQSIQLLLLISYIIIPLSISGQTDDKLTDGMYHLNRYIASDEFLVLSKNSSQLELIDSIYIKSLSIFEYDYSEALLALTFTTLPYKEMNLEIPVFGLPLVLYLPSVDDSLFLLKNRNLPSNYLLSSKKSSESDKDKTTHFFGNAFLSYSINIFQISKYFGIMVELFEATFKVEGFLDERDLLINELGSNFGKYLREEKNLLPSQFFNILNYLEHTIRFIH